MITIPRDDELTIHLWDDLPEVAAAAAPRPAIARAASRADHLRLAEHENPGP